MKSETITLDTSKGWLPDFISFAMPPGGLIKAVNVVPYSEGLYPFLSKTVYSSSAVTGTSITAKEFKNDADNNFYVFIGTSSKLFRMNLDKTLTDVSKAATDYSTGENQWSFEKYGSWIIATNYVYAPQVLKGFTAANYQDLGGAPPKAKYSLFYMGYLIFGYLNESGTIGPKKIACSAYDNVEDWTASLSTGAFRTVLEDADGYITGMVSLGNSFVIGHKNSITIGYFTGRPYPFKFIANKIKNIGVVEGTLISVGSICYFMSENDMYSFDGETVTALGYGTRKQVSDIINYGLSYKFSAAHDARNSIIYWGYSTTNSSNVLDRIICYNYKTNKFTSVEVDFYSLFSFHTGAGLSDAVDSIYATSDSVPYDADSNYWLGNAPVIGCIDNNTQKISTFNGAALAGLIETAEVSFKNKIFMVNRVRPKISNSVDNVVVRIGTRFNENDAVVFSAATTVGGNGYADVRASGRYVRIEVVTGLHKGMAMIDVDVVQRGNR